MPRKKPESERTAPSLEQHRPAGRILIIDDDYAVRRALHITLYDQGFDVAEASSGEDALSVLRALRFDAVLLDINMPGRNGIEICRDLRRLFPRLAVLMLTVRDGQEDRVEAFEAGADDYIAKPFHMRELTARLRATVRRVQMASTDVDDIVQIGNISLYPTRRLVQKSGQTVHLTPKEFDLLAFLMKHKGLPINHGRLLASVWGPEYSGQVEYLRTFIRQLRRKLEDDPADPQYLLTNSHVGYRFADSVPSKNPSQPPPQTPDQFE